MRRRLMTCAALALALTGCDGWTTASDQANAERMAADIERQADNMEAMADQATAMVATAGPPREQIRPVCKAAMAQLFGHSPTIMTATGSDDLIRVSYRRPDDGKSFTNDCKIEGDKIIWRSVNATPGSGNGPWRTREGDDAMTFKIDGKRVYFTILYSDGSVNTESQPLS